MLGQLFVALTVGIFTATMGLQKGYSSTAVLSYLVLSRNSGLLAGAAAASLFSWPQTRRADHSARGRQQFELGCLVIALFWLPCGLALQKQAHPGARRVELFPAQRITEVAPTTSSCRR